MKDISNATGRLARVVSMFPGVSLLTAMAASAHPGHGLSEAGATHVLTSPDHLLTMVVVALAVGLGARWVRSPRVRRSLQFGAAVTLGAVLAVWIG